MKKIFISLSFLFSILFYSNNSTAQVKVSSNGGLSVGSTSTPPTQGLYVNSRIGVGVTPTYKFEVKGTTGSSDGIKISNTANTYFLRMTSSNPTAEIGTNSDKIVFYYSTYGYHKIYAESYTTISDKKYKTDIKDLTQNLEKVKKIKGVKYKLNEDLLDSTKISEEDYIGFIAQDIQKIIPEVVHQTPKGDLGIDYTAIIPVIVEAMKEQQVQIENLQTIVESQEQELTSLRNENKSSTTKPSAKEQTMGTEIQLYQNTPNPFFESTEIKYDIPISFENATLFIYNLQGFQIKSHTIELSGNGSIKLNASTLKAGMYIYSLVVDNNIIDTKRMILTNN